jgi:type VI secretion system protein ImpB
MSGNSRDKENSGRVYITYDVHAGDARVKRELPFVVGVIGDFAGSRKLEPLADRRFIDVDRRNLDTVMAGIRPQVTLELEAGRPAQTLTFTSMADFEPARLAEKIPEIRELTEIRVRLRELLTKANRSEDLTELLRQIMDPQDRDNIAGQLGLIDREPEPGSEPQA